MTALIAAAPAAAAPAAATTPTAIFEPVDEPRADDLLFCELTDDLLEELFVEDDFGAGFELGACLPAGFELFPCEGFAVDRIEAFAAGRALDFAEEDFAAGFVADFTAAGRLAADAFGFAAGLAVLALALGFADDFAGFPEAGFAAFLIVFAISVR